MKPEPPLLGSRETLQPFTRELWQLKWRPNDALDLWVILPARVKNSPVVLYIYGFPADTARFRDVGYAQRVTQNGAAAVGFMTAMTGHRADHRPLKENFISDLPEALASSVHDVQLILDYLQSRGDLDMSRVGIFGQGSGATVAILAAAVDPRIKALDLLDPWGDWPQWYTLSRSFPDKDRANYLKPEFLKQLEPLEPLKYLPQLKTQKIRIQYEADAGLPAPVAEKIRSAAPPTAQYVRYETAVKMHDDTSGGRLFDWIAKQLDAKPAPRLAAQDSSPAVAGTAPPK